MREISCQSQEIREHIIRYASVTIENNGVTYPLTSNISDDYFLKNYFTTSKLIGEVGQSYKLRVEWNGKTATAITSIPSPVEVDTFEVVFNEALGAFQIKASFHDDPQARNFYKFSVWVENSQKYYTTSFFSMIDDARLEFEDEKEHIIRSYVDHGNQLPDLTPKYYFQSGDVVNVKFATMNEESYRFWSCYNQNALIVSFPINVAAPECEGNIDGALGYWDGYGINEYKICVD